MMVDQITLGNGVAVSEGLDSSGMPRVASIATSGASTNWSSGAYAYDGAGNVKSIGTLHFVYDKASRLTSGGVKVGATTKTQTAAYDSFGNITSTHTSSWGTQTFSLSPWTNRLNWPATYDAAGHLQQWGGYSYAYNAAGQLLTATGTSVNHTYLYTASGERIADRNFLNNTTILALRGLDGKLLRLYSETGTSGHGAMSWLEDQVWGGGRLLGTVSPTEGRRYYAADHLGTPRLACDRCKDAPAQHAYYPFGLEATDPTQDAEPTRFTSQETDLQSTPGQADDLVNMHARFYHPTLARFLSADLLRGNPHSPQSFNLFSYVRGNPTSYWDPFGLEEIEVIGKDPCPEAPAGMSCDEWTWVQILRLLDPASWTNGGGGGGGTSWRDEGGGGKSLRDKICSALPSGRTFGVSGTFGGAFPSGYGGELVLNCNSGQVSAFGFGTLGAGWNGGLQGSVYTGFVGGLSRNNSSYSGGFTGINGSLVSPSFVGAGVFGAASSGGLAGPLTGRSPLPTGDVTVAGLELSFSPPGFTGAVTTSTYSHPVQLGKLWAFTPIDGLMYEARKVFCK